MGCPYLDIWIWIRIASRWSNSIFDFKIEISCQINEYINIHINFFFGCLYLDIRIWIPGSGEPPVDLDIWSWSLIPGSGQPQGVKNVFLKSELNSWTKKKYISIKFYFWFKIEISCQINEYINIHINFLAWRLSCSRYSAPDIQV